MSSRLPAPVNSHSSSGDMSYIHQLCSGIPSSKLLPNPTAPSCAIWSPSPNSTPPLAYGTLPGNRQAFQSPVSTSSLSKAALSQYDGTKVWSWVWGCMKDTN
ncbi:hypothetical protein DPEC_G00292770 [Dallia pectoralis]|uniref:Uncharacterized protein n=1 Tax=Dallia pectoralis TaxID=75939 RepID=A0ACC2FI79_DALPE|nr:hypothetical protein DPEC_G00292770 [Dallia pectoralis]